MPESNLIDHKASPLAHRRFFEPRDRLMSLFRSDKEKKILHSLRFAHHLHFNEEYTKTKRKNMMNKGTIVVNRLESKE
jgi:hypothetical protein